MRNQMHTLTQTIADSARQRQAVLSQSVRQTEVLLREFGLARLQAAKELRQALNVNREERSQEVYALLFEANSDRIAFSQELHQAMQVQANELKQDCSARRHDVSNLLETFRTEKNAMSNEISTALFQQGLDRSREISALIDGFRLARVEMARALSAHLGGSAQSTQNALAKLIGLRSGATRPLPVKQADKSTIPNYLLNRATTEGNDSPKASSHLMSDEINASKPIELDDSISVAVRRAQEPSVEAAPQRSAIENAFSSVAGRPVNKAPAKPKKK